ncbi:MAG: hypothetical protein JWQ42_2226 [Edaphobacter sp.]|nr:hypothetical protein [Edaphobacter sp.]
MTDRAGQDGYAYRFGLHYIDFKTQTQDEYSLL